MPLTSNTVDKYFSTNRTFCGLFYGAPGTGKTLLAATGQEHNELKDVAFVDADPGLISLAGYDDKIVKVSFDQVRDLMQLPRFLKQTHPTVHTVVFDTVTAIVGKRLMELSEQGFASKKRGEDELQIQDYKIVTGNIEKLISLMRQAGYSVIMTAGVKDDVINGSLVERRADLPPELARRMNHIADHIWHLYIANDNSYNLLYRPTTLPSGALVQAKTRNLDFNNALAKRSRPQVPGVVQIGKVGDTQTEYPNLKDFYNDLLSAIDKDLEKV